MAAPAEISSSLLAAMALAVGAAFQRVGDLAGRGGHAHRLFGRQARLLLGLGDFFDQLRLVQRGHAAQAEALGDLQ